MARPTVVVASLGSAILVLAPPARAQGTESLVQALAKAESLDDEAVGDGGVKSETWKTFEALRACAGKDELTALLEHASPIVRGYACRALMDTQPAADWPKLLAARIADAAAVITFEGCTRSEHKLGDVVLEWARTRKLLADEQWLDLAEAMVKGKSPLLARGEALRTLRFRPAMHDALRALARGGDADAHVALARYLDIKDLPVITIWLERETAFEDRSAFLAAQVFVDGSLLPPLVAGETKARAAVAAGRMGTVREWMAAIAAQKNAAASACLARFLSEAPADATRRELVQAVKGVLLPYGADPVFADVREVLVRLARR